MKEETQKRAILSMGLPGSGKSTVLKKKFNVKEFVLVDPDIIKQSHKDYDPKNPSVLHTWSKQIANVQIAQAIADQDDLIIDGTGSNVEYMYKTITELKAARYHVTLLYVKVSLETALKRNRERERSVSDELIYEKSGAMAYSFEILSGIANEVIVVKND